MVLLIEPGLEHEVPLRSGAGFGDSVAHLDAVDVDGGVLAPVRRLRGIAGRVCIGNVAGNHIERLLVCVKRPGHNSEC